MAVARTDRPAERVRQQLFGHGPHELLACVPCSSVRSPAGPANCVPSGRTPAHRSASRPRPSATVRRIVVLERQAERIHRRVADAALRISPMLLHPFAHRCRTATLASLGRSGTSAGGGGGGVPSTLASTHLPRSTGDVRFGYDVTVSRLPWPRMPPRDRRLALVERHAPEMARRRRSGCRSVRARRSLANV